MRHIRKIAKAAGNAPLPRGSVIRDVVSRVPDCVWDKLSSKEATEVLIAIDKAYHDGERHRQEDIDNYIGSPFWDTFDADHIEMALKAVRK